MPKKATAKRRTASKARATTTKIGTMTGGVIGNIKAGRDVVMGDQLNDYRDYRQQIAQIATPQQFVSEIEKIQAQIADAKKNPALPATQIRLIEAAEGDLKEVAAEAKKDKPNSKSMAETLKSATETIEGVGKTVDAVQKTGEKVDTLIKLTDWARIAAGLGSLAGVGMKLFGM